MANKRRQLLVRSDILTTAATTATGSKKTTELHGCPSDNSGLHWLALPAAAGYQ